MQLFNVPPTGNNQLSETPEGDWALVDYEVESGLLLFVYIKRMIDYLWVYYYIIVLLFVGDGELMGLYRERVERGGLVERWTEII